MAAWRDTSHLAPGVPMKEREVVDMGDGTAVVFRRRVMSASDNPLNELEKICAIAADAQKEKLAALARITELEKERDQYKVEFDATTDAVTVHIIQQRDAALSRVKALEEEASLIRVAHGCGVKGPP